MRAEAAPTFAPAPANGGSISLPEWFEEGRWAEKLDKMNDTAVANLLTGLRQDVYSALTLYQVVVKHANNMAVSVLAITGAVFSLLNVFQPVPDHLVRLLEIVAALILAVAGGIAIVSAFVIMRYYNVYVGALLYAAEVHSAAGMGGFYWFERLISGLAEEYRRYPSLEKSEFVTRRSLSINDSNFWYTVILVALSVACAAFALILWLAAPVSGQGVELRGGADLHHPRPLVPF